MWRIDSANPGRLYTPRRIATSSSVTESGLAMSHSRRDRTRSSPGSSAAAWLSERMRSITSGVAIVPPGVLSTSRPTRSG